MDTRLQLKGDRVRKNTPQKLNEKIDRKTGENIRQFTSGPAPDIEDRIKRLNKEWDTERSLQLISALNVLAGIGLGLAVNKKWLWLSGISAAFLVQHAIQGWCPPLPVLRAAGVRTPNEINIEKNALMEARNASGTE